LLINPEARLSAQRLPQKKAFTVVIDPGHGGKDPGTVYKNIYEKDIALGIALKLGNYIKKNLPDVRVLYTRKTDVFIDLDKRAPVANKNQADLFISIHVNSNDKSTKADGTETFLMGPAKSDENLEVAKKENAVILLEDNYSSKYDGYDPNSPNSFIALSLLQNTHWKQSLHFASYVQAQMHTFGKRPDRGVKQAGFLVLWRTAVPSVLIETGFLSNENDRKLLTSQHGQDVLAMSIFRAFRNYKDEVESGRIATSNGMHTSDTLPVVQRKDSVSISPDTLIDDDNGAAKDDSNNDKDQIDFMIQITSSKKPVALKSRNFKGLNDIEEFKVGNLYKYAVGRKHSYNESVEYSKIVKNYYPDAFVIAIKDGKIIPVKEALKEIKD
jgi:N-acetylmuramoyl-L-alanine amidase